VDNLGEIFRIGLRKKATIARLSTLSFQISLFFEGWIKHLCEAREFDQLIYSVYAGGDDIFLIGPWIECPN
jgi:CRISPR-associated protein Csm1